MYEDKPKVIAVVGPTAVGKTWLVSQLTKDLGGEIVKIGRAHV